MTTEERELYDHLCRVACRRGFDSVETVLVYFFNATTLRGCRKVEEVLKDIIQSKESPCQKESPTPPTSTES